MGRPKKIKIVDAPVVKAPEPKVETPEPEINYGLPDKSLFRVDEVASHFGVSVQTVRTWVQHGLLTGEQYKQGGVLRVTRHSIINFRLRSRIIR